MSDLQHPAVTLAQINNGNGNRSVSLISHILGTFHAERPTARKAAELRRQLDALMTRFFAEDPSLPDAMVILRSMFGDGDLIDPSTLALCQRDRLFAQNLVNLRRYFVTTDEGTLISGRILRSPSEEDCLAFQVDEWSLFRVLNIAVMSSLPTSEDVAIVTSVRNEGLNIIEWLAYHRSMGFRSFFIYTNDNTDRSGELLRALAENGLITLIESEVMPETRVQTKVLEHSLHLLPSLRAYKWAFYIDVDEFFLSRCEPGLTLQSFLSRYLRAFPTDEPSGICFNWKWFGSQNQLEITEGLVLERFIYSRHNDHVKSLVRLRDVISMQKVHIPLLAESGWLVDSSLERIENPTIHLKPTYGTGQLNHYWNKSFKEFILKRARGRVSAGTGGRLLEFSAFFDWGANENRGNLDPPPERVIRRLKQEYSSILSNEEIRRALEVVRLKTKTILDKIDKEVDIRSLWERRGRHVH